MTVAVRGSATAPDHSLALSPGELPALRALVAAGGSSHELHVCDRALAHKLAARGWITIAASLVTAGCVLTITDAGRAALATHASDA